LDEQRKFEELAPPFRIYPVLLRLETLRDIKLNHSRHNFLLTLACASISERSRLNAKLNGAKTSDAALRLRQLTQQSCVMAADHAKVMMHAQGAGKGAQPNACKAKHHGIVSPVG